MTNELLVLSGEDILFDLGNVVIHQPRLKEIAFLGEEMFFTGCEFLRFSKDNLGDEDKIHLENYSNFEVLMSMMKENNITIKQHKNCLLGVLSLVFPNYKISLRQFEIVLTQEGIDQEFIINKDNFEAFKDIIETIFCLKSQEEDINPSGEMAKRIADKLKKRKQRLSEVSKDKKVAILSRYVSILAAGQAKDINQLMNYTVFQLFDEFKRYQQKMGYDIYLSARMAGASDLEEPDDWMQDNHPEVQ